MNAPRAVLEDARSEHRLAVALPRPWTLTRWLAAAIAFLVLASTVGQVIRLRFGYTYLHGLIPLFYLDDEANAPTWYSSMTLLLAAALLLAIGATVRRRADRAWRYWAALSAVFLALFVLRFVKFGFTPFTHHGPLRWLYSVVFWTHEPLAVINVPLVLISLGLGLFKSHPAHKEVAKIALPVWLYVACTGVALYVLLYVVPPSAS